MLGPGVAASAMHATQNSSQVSSGIILVGKGRPDRLASPLGGSERTERGGTFHLRPLDRECRRLAAANAQRRYAAPVTTMRAPDAPIG